MQISKALALLAALGISSAATTASGQEIDCKTVSINMESISYKVKSVFPNPVDKSIHTTKPMETDKQTDFTSCGFIVTADADKVIIRAANNKTLMSLLYEGEPSIISIPYGYTGADYGQRGILYQLYLEYADGKFYIDANGMDSSLSYTESVKRETIYRHFNDAVIGYKVDGGPLTPMFYNSIVSSGPIVTDDVVVDFYIMKAKYKTQSSPTRLNFDFTTSTLTMYKDYPFPQK